MRKLFYLLVIISMSVGLFNCAAQQKVSEQAMSAVSNPLPEFVQQQSRKDAKEPEVWKKFDKSGAVKFLQLETTAAASAVGSGAKLDGSAGERLVEIKTLPEVTCDAILWTLENKGPSAVWIVAASNVDAFAPVMLDPAASKELSTPVKEGYAYLVVDSEGGKQTTISIKAKCGETEAKTVGGATMLVSWF